MGEQHVALVPGIRHVVVDKGQFEQVLLNLVVNARDAMPDGGTLVIETREVEIDEAEARRRGARTGRYVGISVTDTGCGIDEQTRTRIFEPFFTTKKTGTGLGLATVHAIVAQSGGHLTVDSKPGLGTSIAVYVPAVEAGEPPAAEVEKAAPSAFAPAAGTILLVEDERSVRLLTKAMLERAGFRVIAAEDGLAALARARDAGAIDLLLTDVIMPGGSGPETFEQLRRDRPGLKVMYMSGYTDDAILVHHDVRNAEAAFLQKPFTSEQLVRKVREALAAA